MAINLVQFQKGLSLSEFMQQYAGVRQFSPKNPDFSCEPPASTRGDVTNPRNSCGGTSCPIVAFIDDA